MLSIKMANVRPVATSSKADKLTVIISKQLIGIRLIKVALFCLLCISASAVTLFSSRVKSLLVLATTQPLLLLLMIATLTLLAFTIQIFFTYAYGQSFSFDRHSDGILLNQRKVAVLSDLKEIQIKQSIFSTEKKTPHEIRLSPELPKTASQQFSTIPGSARVFGWPSIWLIFSNRSAIHLLTTVELVPMRIWLLIINFASRQEVEADAVSAATAISQYTGVTLHNELQFNSE